MLKAVFKQERHCQLAAVVLVAALSLTGVGVKAQTPADQGIWLQGPLLTSVQLSGLFDDSKTFVDMPLLASPGAAQQAFQALPRSADGSIDNPTLSSFISSFFGAAGSDLETYFPEDYSPEVPLDFLANVTDPAIRAWATSVRQLWATLSRVENGSVTQIPDQHSLLPLPDHFVIAGDRFREEYYWDSYWIVQGLIICGLVETAQAEVQNLVSLLQEYGHVPNGARQYYLNRSQPPLLSRMVDLIYEATNDRDFLQEAFEALQTEHDYWTTTEKAVSVRAPDGTIHSLSRYYADWTAPRPEGFSEDYPLGASLTPAATAELYRNIASGAESGMDFTVRWFSEPTANMSTIRTTQIIPVELNAYLYDMERNMAAFATELGNASAAASFTAAAAARATAITALMWNSSAGHWFSLILQDDSQRPATVSQQDIVHVSDYLPLWVGLSEQPGVDASSIVRSLRSSGLIQQHGIATSIYSSGQQWDFPNAWAPMQDMIVEGLQSYGGEEGAALAAQLAQVWLESNYAGYQQTGLMVEKYDATMPGLAGGGGEYTVQQGFGWTNGVMFKFLDTYGWNPSAGAPLPATPLPSPRK
ncbi:hypothetical protein WJX74_005988 [Apatococcus lobatus]|uniref:Trehalase n=2 Tax=Apatococcus TaxID=904362 RepID=A0AAW1T3Q6_9CHLO